MRSSFSTSLVTALEPMFAFESEFYLLEPGSEGGWQPVDLPSHRVYGTGASVDPSGTVDAMVKAAQQCGFPIEGWASEFDSAVDSAVDVSTSAGRQGGAQDGTIQRSESCGTLRNTP